MSFFPELYPWNIVAGLFGGVFFFSWAYIVVNKPQMVVNIAGMVVCVAGLVRYWY